MWPADSVASPVVARQRTFSHSCVYNTVYNAARAHSLKQQNRGTGTRGDEDTARSRDLKKKEKKKKKKKLKSRRRRSGLNDDGIAILSFVMSQASRDWRFEAGN